MAHLIIAYRGIKQDTDRMIKELECAKLPLTFRNKETGEVQTRLVQMAVRPYQICELVFPKEHMDAVCNTLFAGGTGKSNTPYLQKYFNILRKLIGVKPIPDYKKDMIMPIYVANSEVVGIGTKEDGMMEMDEISLKKLGLSGKWEVEAL